MAEIEEKRKKKDEKVIAEFEWLIAAGTAESEPLRFGKIDGDEREKRVG